MSEDLPGSKIIKFSTMEDEGFRNSLKKVHSLAVLLRGAGFPIRSMSGKIENTEIRRHHNIPIKNDYSIIELQDKGEEKNSEVKDWLAINTKATIITDSLFTYNDGTCVYQIIVDCSRL